MGKDPRIKCHHRCHEAQPTPVVRFAFLPLRTNARAFDANWGTNACNALCIWGAFVRYALSKMTTKINKSNDIGRLYDLFSNLFQVLNTG